MLKSLMPALMVFALLIGCSNNGGNDPAPEATDKPAAATNNPGQEEEKPSDLYEIGKDLLNVTFYGHYGWYDMPDWGADPATKWILENKKINVTAISAGGNNAQKLQTMIAGNELPDIIWGQRDADLDRLREAGMLVALDDYIEKYPNFKKYVDPKALDLLRSPDGKIYYFPNYYTNQPNGNAGYVVNKKIYEELGSPKLETTDDLYAYLKQVKEKYGKDITPFETGLAKDGHGVDQLYSAFKENNFSFTRDYGVVNGDQLTSIYKDEGFRESARFAAKLMREGLMTQDAMTQTEDQVKEKLMNGKVAVFASSDPMKLTMPAHMELSKNDPNAGYIMIDPIYKAGLDKSKIYPGTWNMLGWNVATITTSAKNPEAVFAMLDYLTGPEGTSVQMWGPPGPDGYWDGFKEDGSPNFLPRYGEDPAGVAKIQEPVGNTMFVGNTVYMDNAKSQHEATLPDNQKNWATRWQSEVTWKSQGDATEFVNLYPMPETEEGIIKQSVRDIWLQARAEALFAKTDEDVNKILDKAHDDSMAVGFQKYLDFITKRWHENRKALGLE